MIAPDPDSQSPSDDAVAEQAINWFARLRAEDVTENERNLFAEWCHANPAHRRAYDEIALFWDDADFSQLLAAERQTAQIHPLRRPRPKYANVTALALAACLALIAMIHRPFLGCLQADYCSGIGEIRSIALADGSRITLNSNTAISVDLGGGNRHVRLNHGEAYFEVQRNPQLPFLVDARYSTTRVLGTRFIVREDAQSDSVTVVSGLVEVSGGKQSPAQLKANDGITVDAWQHSEIRQVSSINATAWLKGSAAFDNAPLADVVAELSRYRHGGLFIKNSELKNLKVSGRFDITDTDKALEALAQTLPIRIYRLTPWLIVIG